MKLFRTHGRHVDEEKPTGDRRRHARGHRLLFMELLSLFMKLFDKLFDGHTEWVTSR